MPTHQTTKGCQINSTGYSWSTALLLMLTHKQTQLTPGCVSLRGVALTRVSVRQQGRAGASQESVREQLVPYGKVWSVEIFSAAQEEMIFLMSHK